MNAPVDAAHSNNNNNNPVSNEECCTNNNDNDRNRERSGLRGSPVTSLLTIEDDANSKL
jgi:hypothetical protein